MRFTTWVSRIYPKIRTAGKVLNSEGVISLLHSVILFTIPNLLLTQGRLLYHEHSLAVPDDEGNWKIFHLPSRTNMRKIPALSETLSGIHLGSTAHQSILQGVYTYEDFVEVQSEDTVVDVGAYIGGFSMFAANKAEYLIAIDPFASINSCLEENLEHLDNAVVIPKAAWKENTELEISMSARPSKNTVLIPKMSSTDDSFTVSANIVPALVRQHNIDKIDYLKVEGEGVEPEILKGLLNDPMDIPKIAVDAGPERYGESVSEEVIEVLEANNYECRQKDDAIFWGENIVFARKNTITSEVPR